MQKDKRPADTQVVVGPYRIPISREIFLAWEREVMTNTGFTDAAIRAEILRRLGICK